MQPVCPVGRSPAPQLAPTLRAVGGLTTAQIAAALLVLNWDHLQRLVSTLRFSRAQLSASC